MERCKCGKVIFTSESAALRRAEEYEDIKRVYLCAAQEIKVGDEIRYPWHLTSMEKDTLEDLGLKVFRKNASRIKNPKKQIKRRLEYLKKKICT